MARPGCHLLLATVVWLALATHDSDSQDARPRHRSNWSEKRDDGPSYSASHWPRSSRRVYGRDDESRLPDDNGRQTDERAGRRQTSHVRRSPAEKKETTNVDLQRASIKYVYGNQQKRGTSARRTERSSTGDSTIVHSQTYSRGGAYIPATPRRQKKMPIWLKTTSQTASEGRQRNTDNRRHPEQTDEIRPEQLDEIRPRPDERRPRPDERRPRPDERRPRPDERRPEQPDERRPRPDERRPRPDERRPRPDERRPRPDERRPRPDERRPRPDERRPRPDERRPRPDERRPRPDERRPRPDKIRTRPDERRPRPDETRPRPDDRRPRPDERRPRPDDSRPEQPVERRPRPDERRSRPDERHPRPDERRPRPDERRQRPDDRRPRPDERRARPDDRRPRPDDRRPRPDERRPRPDERRPRPDDRRPQVDPRRPAPDRLSPDPRNWRPAPSPDRRSAPSPDRRRPAPPAPSPNRRRRPPPGPDNRNPTGSSRHHVNHNFINQPDEQVLTPPYFNLAVNRRIIASSTCGEDVPEPELFCKLTGANLARGSFARHRDSEEEDLIIQGQLCDHCDPRQTEKRHPAVNAIDGTERWWQSPPLSRGLNYNEVNLTIDLGQEFHVAYVFIKMANSPRPGVFALERSPDNGKTWLPWQYFADTRSDCNTFFGSTEERITHDDTVVCTTEYSKVVPLENGEIVISLVNNRPSAMNFSYSQTLQDWTKATSVRLRLLRTKTLLGHLMAVAREDWTVTRRYYYSIKDISIGGRCVCNGHASLCNETDPQDKFKLLCSCQHDTCGPQCEVCCPGFIQKPWRAATIHSTNACEPCECFNHSSGCVYDEDVNAAGLSIDIHGQYRGGGVCQRCRHHTAGVNCELCESGYYRPDGVDRRSPNACRPCRCEPAFSTGDCEDGSGRCLCKPKYSGDFCDRCSDGYYGYPQCYECDCFYNGTRNHVCEVGGRQCPCLQNYAGLTCKECAYSYYNFPVCQRCVCDRVGSQDDYCDETGQCRCQANFNGLDCSYCANGYYNFPACRICLCDPTGSSEEICNKDDGACQCRPGFGGSQCDTCQLGSYGFPYCRPCDCSSPGADRDDCDARGQCVCKYNYAGLTCDRCAAGFYKYPECLSCACDNYGSRGVSCEQDSGQCECADNFEGLNCNKCRPTYYNYPNCEECNCNPVGAKEVPGYPVGGCGSSNVRPGQLCECKAQVGGRICDSCLPGYWNLDINNPRGCEDCDCHPPGCIARNSYCDPATGQCVCKTYTAGRRCERCLDGTYNLQQYNVFGCQDCKCDVGGSTDNKCDSNSGQCNCKPRINSRRCDEPLAMHYFPTLYQHKYEFEDGRTPSGGIVRYGFDERIFPGYSWRGYAILSRLQDEVVIDVDIERPSLYRLIFNYANRNNRSVTADVTVTPRAATDVEQTSTVLFEPSIKPRRVTVSGTGVVSTFVLNPGRWTISLKTPASLFVDYMVVLPQAYYEATILQERVTNPCLCPATSALCKHYVYTDVSSFPSVRGEGGRADSRRREPTQLFEDRGVCDELGTTGMALLNRRQTDLYLTLPVSQEGEYVLLIEYRSSVPRRSQSLDVNVAAVGNEVSGSVALPNCPYSSLCRQVVVDSRGEPLVFNLGGTHASITLTASRDINLAINSVIAVPAAAWQVKLMTPRLKCIRRDKQCTESSYPASTGGVRVEFESGRNADRIATDIPPSVIDTSVRVIKIDQTLPQLNVKTAVSNPGAYVVIVHYYQPYNLGIEVDVTVNDDGQAYKGTLAADYCPSVSGCRAIVRFPAALRLEAIDLQYLDLLLTFTGRGVRPVWLDYVMIVPSQQFRPELVQMRPVDKSAEFITRCGRDEYEISSTVRGFCRQAVFSLATDYNNEAMECACDVDGSLSLNCEKLGGQCRCKAGVIGRTCSQCRTGYYGFPACRPCNCPSGLCDPVDGQCVCPPRVTGEDCDSCLPMTFGFDRLIGCEDCGCNPRGVRFNNLECDIDNGKCSCEDNVAGRRCDACTPGFYSFPRCMTCDCDPKGSLPEICDQQTSACLCKKNVESDQCSDCKPGMFYLEDRNPDGCTSCFCFGATTRCRSSEYRREQVRTMSGWGVTNVDRVQLRKKGRGVEMRVRRTEVIDQSQSLYWIAPAPFLGSKVTAYGGKLIYSVRFRLPQGRQSSGLIQPDIRIEGNNQTIVHTSYQQPSPGESLIVVVDLLETEFSHESSGARVSRDQFLMILANIDALQIRASYYTVVNFISLMDVQMDVASSTGDGPLALNVEQCQCPTSYAGTSCERCAAGYYRQRSGAHLGVCVPCQCHGRASNCDPNTGECLDCSNNFDGPQCIRCRPGHFLDIDGSCKICKCPLAVESNNFANGCEEFHHGQLVRCDCWEGYAGTQCETCDLGYWGNPWKVGGSCQLCDCSGNIDVHDPTSCDPTSGECVRCLNNSTGDRCEQCREWYWGDAVSAKSCKPCSCNPVGTERCNDISGECICKNNVIGVNCDMCEVGTFGYSSGRGCQRCDCGLAAVSSACDSDTGYCECRPGVTGRNCDQCQHGFWDYRRSGCRECRCKADGATTCDAVSGKCQCLPGVTGDKCDSCLPRWVLVPQQGCHECDDCVHLLLDDMDALSTNITVMIIDLDTISVGVRAFRRLEKIKRTVTEYRPLVNQLIDNPTDPTILDQYRKMLKRMFQLARDVTDKADNALRLAEVVQADATDTRIDSETLDDIIAMGFDAARAAVNFAEQVYHDILSSPRSDEIIKKLERRAEVILAQIKARDFSGNDRAASNELELAIDTLNRAMALHRHAVDQKNRTEGALARLDDVRDRLRDLMNNSRHALDNSQAALIINKRQANIKMILDQIKSIFDETTKSVDMAWNMLNEARTYLNEAASAYKRIERELSRLDSAADRLKESVEVIATDNNRLLPLVEEAAEHARKMMRQADYIDSMISNTRSSAELALNASRAYQAIIDAINDAMNMSSSAIDSAKQAYDLSDGLASRARKSRKRSEKMKEKADEIKETVTFVVRPRLEVAIEVTQQIETVNEKTKTGLQELEKGLSMIPEGGSREAAQRAADVATAAEERAKNAEIRIEHITSRLPEDVRRARQMPRDIEDANQDIRKARAQVKDVNDLVPRTTILLETLTERGRRINRVGVDLTESIRSLKEYISLSRGEANRIRVGVSFQRNTTLQVRNPLNLMQAGSYSRLSLFFKTKQQDGLLAYIGPDRSSRQTTDDFIALEIIDGNIVFKMELGAGTVSIVNPAPVSDGQWHEVIAERTGRLVHLTVRTADVEDVATTGKSRGTLSVLDLHPYDTKFYVGGIPTHSGLESKLKSLRYVGCIEDIRFSGVMVGLWDFIAGQNNGNGCPRRGVLPKEKATGFRFDGTGYVVLRQPKVKPSSKTDVKLEFRTFSSDGLLLLMGERKSGDFFALELQDGRVLLRYDLGSGPTEMSSTEKYNDGAWHVVIVLRRNKQAALVVDGRRVSSGLSSGKQTKLNVSSQIYIGGYKGRLPFPDVTRKVFEGCIKEVQVGRDAMAMVTTNLYAKGVMPGCPEVARIVSFAGRNSYIALAPESVDVKFEMTMKFKTTEKDGLLFYTSDESASHENAFSLSISDGRIIAITKPEGRRTVLETGKNNYNDGRWHYVTITKDGKELQLDLDDAEMVKTRAAGKKKLATTSMLFFGGLPPGFPMISENVGTEVQYTGCIGDVTINGNLINFADAATDQQRGTSAWCPVLDPTLAPTTQPTLPPIVVLPKRFRGGDPASTQCKLSTTLDSRVGGEEEGSRFGSHPLSRWEFQALPADFTEGGEFSLQMKTTASDGMILYMADDRQVDFVALYLKAGLLVYAFNCGSSPVVIRSGAGYNDGQWHSVRFSRDGRQGRLVVDGETVEGEADGRANSINVSPPFFIGGMTKKSGREAASNLEDTTQSFDGCLRYLTLNKLEFEAPSAAEFVQPCATQMERGMFFLAEGGYNRLKDNFNVGLDLDIKFNFKPRTMSGVLLSVSSPKGDYLIIQMVDGELIFSVENGAGEISTKYSPTTKNELCDGEWHSIDAKKAKNVVTLNVDDVSTFPGMGMPGVSDTDTNDPLYIGGIPANEQHPGIRTREQYVGCIANVVLGRDVQDLNSGQANGGVLTGGCPSN